MAEFIAESPRLLRLDLRENEIKTGGLMALSLALKVNTSLLRLDLDREPKKETVSMGVGGRGEEVKGQISSKQRIQATPGQFEQTQIFVPYGQNSKVKLTLPGRC